MPSKYRYVLLRTPHKSSSQTEGDSVETKLSSEGSSTISPRTSDEYPTSLSSYSTQNKRRKQEQHTSLLPPVTANSSAAGDGDKDEAKHLPIARSFSNKEGVSNQGDNLIQEYESSSFYSDDETTNSSVYGSGGGVGRSSYAVDNHNDNMNDSSSSIYSSREGLKSSTGSSVLDVQIDQQSLIDMIHETRREIVGDVLQKISRDKFINKYQDKLALDRLKKDKRSLENLTKVINASRTFLQYEFNGEEIQQAARNYLTTAQFNMANNVNAYEIDSMAFKTMPYEPLDEPLVHHDPDMHFFKEKLMELVEAKEEYGKTLDEYEKFVKGQIDEFNRGHSLSAETSGIEESTINNAKDIHRLACEDSLLVSETMSRYIDLNDDHGHLIRYQFALLEQERLLNTGLYHAKELLQVANTEKELGTLDMEIYKKIESQLPTYISRLDKKIETVKAFEQKAKKRSDVLWKDGFQQGDGKLTTHQSDKKRKYLKFNNIGIDSKGFYRKDKRRLKEDAKIAWENSRLVSWGRNLVANIRASQGVDDKKNYPPKKSELFNPMIVEDVYQQFGTRNVVFVEAGEHPKSRSFAGKCLGSVVDKDFKQREAFVEICGKHFTEVDGKRQKAIFVARLSDTQLKDLHEIEIGKEYSVKAGLPDQPAQIKPKESKSFLKKLLGGSKR